MLLHVKAAQWRLGTLQDNSEGKDLIAATLEWTKAQGILEPERVIQVIAPGF